MKRLVSMRLLWCLAFGLSTAVPLAAQGITGPGKPGKEAPADPERVLEELSAWAARGDFVLQARPLVAVVREPVKPLGLGGMDLERRMQLKRALVRVETRIRSAVKAARAGHVSPARARAEIRRAVDAYVSSLRTLTEPPR